MPYSQDKPPKAIADMPEDAQRVFIAAFNSAWKRYGEADDAEARCHAIAYSAVKRAGFRKTADGWEKADGDELAEEVMADEMTGDTDTVEPEAADESDEPEDTEDAEEPAEAASDLSAYTVAQDATQLVTLSALVEDTAGGDRRTSTVEVARVGSYTDAHGKNVEITEAALDNMVRNFTAQAAGQDVPVDVMHEKREAGGWLRRIWRNGKLLLAEVEWNGYGQKLVGDRVYRYLSASIAMPDWVLRSVSLVNFPAIKGLAPVELSEWLLHSTQPTKRSERSTVTTGLELAAPARPPAARQQPKVAQATPRRRPTIGGISMTDVIEETVATEPEVLDLSAFTAALQEAKKEAVAELSAQIVAEMATKRAEMLVQLREEMEDERELGEFVLTATSRGSHALPLKPDALADVLRELPKPQRAKVMALLADVAAAGTVDMGEVGTSAAASDKRTLEAPIADLLRSAQANGLSIKRFFQANPELGAMAEYDLAEFEVHNG